MTRIGIIDADLLDGKSNFPNLALMKISGFNKKCGNDVDLLTSYSEILDYDLVYVSKVFNFTYSPAWIEKQFNVVLGGTGFYEDGGLDLPDVIEHSKPDYDLYKFYVNQQITAGADPKKFDHYLNYSIGFTTRGCFRKCGFCVNQKYNRAFSASKPAEFIDDSKKKIMLLDDNFLAYSDWESILNELEATGKPIQFNQGLDIRLLNARSAERFARAKTFGDIIFAFDHPEDAELIEKKLLLWRSFSKKSTKLYVLCAYDSQDEKDIIGIFDRLKIIMKYGCLPYLMRFEAYQQSELKGLYITLARWCNQPNFFKKLSFREFCELNQKLKKDQAEIGSSLRALNDFEGKYPEIASRLFDMKFESLKITA
jgi:hypothetical protein